MAKKIGNYTRPIIPVNKMTPEQRQELAALLIQNLLNADAAVKKDSQK